MRAVTSSCPRLSPTFGGIGEIRSDVAHDESSWFTDRATCSRGAPTGRRTDIPRIPSRYLLGRSRAVPVRALAANSELGKGGLQEPDHLLEITDTDVGVFKSDSHRILSARGLSKAPAGHGSKPWDLLGAVKLKATIISSYGAGWSSCGHRSRVSLHAVASGSIMSVSGREPRERGGGGNGPSMSRNVLFRDGGRAAHTGGGPGPNLDG